MQHHGFNPPTGDISFGINKGLFEACFICTVCFERKGGIGSAVYLKA